MAPQRFLMRLATLSVSALMLAACAGSPGKLNVDVEKALSECQRLGRVQPVGEINEDSDYRWVAADALSAINKAVRLDQRRIECEKSVAAKYKNAGSSRGLWGFR